MLPQADHKVESVLLNFYHPSRSTLAWMGCRNAGEAAEDVGAYETSVMHMLNLTYDLILSQVMNGSR